MPSHLYILRVSGIFSLYSSVIVYMRNYGLVLFSYHELSACPSVSTENEN